MIAARYDRQKPAMLRSKNAIPPRSRSASRQAPWRAIEMSLAVVIAQAPSSSGPRHRSGSGEIEVEHRLVDVAERGDVGEIDALVDLVHRQSDEAKLGDRAERLDEARVGGAAGRAELGRPAGPLRDRGGQDLADDSGRRQEGFAAHMDLKLVGSADRIELSGKPATERIAR